MFAAAIAIMPGQSEQRITDISLEIGLLKINSDNAIMGIAPDLPILITGGEADPVGGDRGMTKLLQHYAQTGHQRLTAKIYPGGRHEMLNEINRDEVTADWLDWILAVCSNVRLG